MPLARMAVSSDLRQKFHIVYSVASMRHAGASHSKYGARYPAKYMATVCQSGLASASRLNEPNSSKSRSMETNPARQ